MTPLSPRFRPVRVLYVADSAKIGGGNRSLEDLVLGLDRDRFAPFVVAPSDGALVAWAQAADVPHRIIRSDDLQGRLGMLRRALHMLLACGRERVGIVHAMAPSCYRAAGLAGSLMGATRICHLGFPPRPVELEWSFRFGPDAVVGCYDGQSREVMPTVERIRPRARVVDIPYGIDIREFAPVSSSAGAKWRFGAEHVVLIVGHLSEVKGYPTFLRAAAIVASVLDDCAFVALGGERTDSGYGAVLERLAADLGIRSRVHFLGWRQDVAEILNAADIVVLPSLAEGLPLAILEAMACARPVIATGVGGIPQAVLDGQTGLLVPPDDPDALSRAMLRLMQDRDLARRFGEEGRRHVEREFSRERFVARIQTLYDELTEAGTRKRRTE